MATTTLELGSHYFEAGGIRFHYRVVGSGPLVIVQSVGWGMPGHYLSNGIERLAKSHTVVYFDPRGNGLSNHPADDNTMCSKFMLDDLEYLRAELGLETLPVLLGHSNGAGIALGYAEKYPNRVNKLILVSSQIHNGPAGSSESNRQWIEKRKQDPRYAPLMSELNRSIDDLPQTVEEFQKQFHTILPWYLAEKKYDLASAVEKQIENGNTPPSIYAYLLYRRLELMEENQISHISDSGRVQAKTLILWGKNDAVCSIIGGNALAEAIPGSQMVAFDDCGHFPWVEAPEPFWTAMDMFLQA
jgi:pimeloyl-ACP methyl ester carboxylesterase